MPVARQTVGLLTGSGRATVTLNTKQQTLDITGEFSGLSGPAISAHLRVGYKGIPGPVVVALEIEPLPSGKFGGEIPLTEAIKNNLFSNSLYLQIQATGAEEGIIRGWILP